MIVYIVINEKLPRLHSCNYLATSEDTILLWTSWSQALNNFPPLFLYCSLNFGIGVKLLMYQVGLSTPRIVVLYILDSVDCYIVVGCKNKLL